MTHDPDHNKVTGEEADTIVAPENIEKLYGQKAVEPEPSASNVGEVDVALPEDTDGVAEENMFPSAD